MQALASVPAWLAAKIVESLLLCPIRILKTTRFMLQFTPVTSAVPASR